MDILKELCNEYIIDPKYVFKSCGNYIVILEKLPDTVTNEARKNLSKPMYASYRANKLRVVLIINKFVPSDIIKEIENTFYKYSTIRYEKDKIVEENYYDMYLTKVCTTGIHYFKTIEPAFYFQLLYFNPTYTGKYIEWYANGDKLEEGEYLDREKTGKWIYWYPNGNKQEECEYLDVKKTGKCIQWYESGNKLEEGEYLDGKKTGKWILLYENGTKLFEGEYLDGKVSGKMIYYYDNGNKLGEGEYLDGKKTGKWIGWHENGNKREEGEFLDGRETGKWIFYCENGNLDY